VKPTITQIIKKITARTKDTIAINWLSKDKRRYKLTKKDANAERPKNT
jgi:hypothetical protein